MCVSVWVCVCWLGKLVWPADRWQRLKVVQGAWNKFSETPVQLIWFHFGLVAFFLFCVFFFFFVSLLYMRSDKIFDLTDLNWLHFYKIHLQYNISENWIYEDVQCNLLNQVHTVFNKLLLEDHSYEIRFQRYLFFHWLNVLTLWFFRHPKFFSHFAWQFRLHCCSANNLLGYIIYCVLYMRHVTPTTTTPTWAESEKIRLSLSDM